MEGGRGSALLDRVDRYRTRAVAPVREVRAELPGKAVPYDVRGRQVKVNPRLLSYWIPFVAGVGLMIGGMKTAVVPWLGIPQLVIGVALIATAAWDFVIDSGRLDFRPSPPAVTGDEAGAPKRRRAAYDEKFRRHAVHMVRSTGQPIAAIARELDVNPSTLAGWVRKDRIQRERAGIA